MRLSLILLLACACLSAADYTGTWRANVAKSKFGTPTQSYSMKVDQTGPNAYFVTFDRTFGDGQQVHQQFPRIYDGREHVTGTDMAEICTQVDEWTRHIVQKNKGKVTSELDSKLAPDGRTMITRRTSFRDNGERYESEVVVFERK